MCYMYLFLRICGVKTIFWSHSRIFKSMDVSLPFFFFCIILRAFRHQLRAVHVLHRRSHTSVCRYDPSDASLGSAAVRQVRSTV